MTDTAFLTNSLYNKQSLTSKGSAVALATPWTSLLETQDPLFTCGPAPSKCCSTLKARASLVLAAADWLTTAEWTRLLVLGIRISPEEKQEETAGGVRTASRIKKSCGANTHILSV